MTADLDFDGFNAEVIAHRLILTFLGQNSADAAIDAWDDIADAEDLSESSWREVAQHLTCLAAAHLCNEVGPDDATQLTVEQIEGLLPERQTGTRD